MGLFIGVLSLRVYWVKNEFEICWSYEWGTSLKLKGCERFLSLKISICVGIAMSVTIGLSKLRTNFNIAVIILIISILLLKQGFQKRKVVNRKTTFFVIGPFSTPHSICLNSGFWQSSFVWNYCVFDLSISTKKNSAPVFRISFRFSEFFFFNVKAFK